MSDQPNKTITRLRLIRRISLGLAVLILIAAGAVVFQRSLDETGRATTATGTAPEVKIGGPFTLTDHTGRQVTEADFRGRYMLIFFGYTFCPDVCPTSLTEISAAMDKLGDRAAKVVPILVTIDPARDTATALKDYVAHFHPSVVGLTGTPEQIKQAAKAYRVYYAKVPDKGGDKDAYLMDHSSVIYLMGPDGGFLAHFSHQTDAETMAAKIKSFL
ncbi:MAG: SCO family protein [Rhodospirillales bacterium CG15_BIG_FIL_POST_REV_8_21_14_020_66_15]|nr:MAG: SCO family protein [Rhodospirillales bacterium CG15_BIG_FIL_POST_REV_8_21_14_020_66_15]